MCLRAFVPSCLSLATTRVASEVLPWLGAIVVLVLIGSAAIALAHKWLHRDESKTGDFSLHQLRQMHREGSLTDEEFERAKRAVIGRMTADQSEDESGDEAESEGNL